jgi:thiamine biosynthesis protein ThiS
MNTSDSFAVIVDNAPRVIEAGTTLGDLVAQLGHQPADVATAVNGRFASRPARAQLVLKPGDAVTLFQPIVGG